jgi:hypothetical protein
MRGVGIDHEAEEWRLRPARSPHPDESLDGYICFRAAEEGLDNAMHVTALAGVWHATRPDVALKRWDGLPKVAEALGVPVEELQRRSYPELDADAQRRLFFNVAVTRGDLETRTRRYSPAGLIRSPHARATWQLRMFPFCPDGGDYLLSTCPRCGETQGWHFTNGIPHCDRCVEDLRTAHSVPVPEHVLERLRLAVGTCHPDPARRERTMALLPKRLRLLGPSNVLALLCELAGLADASGRIGRSRGNRGGSLDYSVGIPETCEAMADGWDLLAGWPEAPLDLIGRRIGLSAKGQDGTRSLVRRFLAAPERQRTPTPVARLIAELRGAMLLDGPSCGLDAPAGMRTAEAARALSVSTNFLPELRREGIFKVRCGIVNDILVPVFDRAEMESIALLKRDRLALSAAAWRTGLTLNGIEQLVAMDLLAVIDHPFFERWHGERHITEQALGAIEAQLRENACRDAEGAAPLADAMNRIGGTLKPWGPAMAELLAGTMPFCLREGRRLVDRIAVTPAAALRLAALRFDPADWPGARFSNGLSDVDAGVILNVQPYAIASLNPSRISDPNRPNLLPDVLAIGARSISNREIMARIGGNQFAAMAMARASGALRLSRWTWERAKVEPMLR